VQPKFIEYIHSFKAIRSHQTKVERKSDESSIFELNLHSPSLARRPFGHSLESNSSLNPWEQQIFIHCLHNFGSLGDNSNNQNTLNNQHIHTIVLWRIIQIYSTIRITKKSNNNALCSNIHSFVLQPGTISVQSIVKYLSLSLTVGLNLYIYICILYNSREKGLINFTGQSTKLEDIKPFLYTQLKFINTMAPALRNALADLAQVMVPRSSDSIPSGRPSNATADTKTADLTIAPYATALNGVNQSQNKLFRDILWWSMGILAMLILVARMTERLTKHYRHMTAMSLPAGKQKYWAQNMSNWWKIKKHFIYAPLWKKRHNREFRISTAINIGTLPSRLHSILLMAYVLSNLAYCAAIDYSKKNHYEVVAELRGRSGVLALINMIPLIIMAGRNNPLISLLQISFDTYNLLHRWMGRIVVLESIVHTLAWWYVKHAATGWAGVRDKIVQDPFIGYGTVGTASIVLMFLLSPSPLRHAFYETFLNVHIILALITMVCVYVHVRLAGLVDLSLYMLVIILLWLADRMARFARLVYYNYRGKRWTNATVDALPGDASRVTLHLPRHVEIGPGTHAYLRFAKINGWESHPFSIAWVHQQVAYFPRSEKDAEDNKPAKIDKSSSTTDVSFVIHAQTGMTRRLFDKATAAGGSVTLRAAFEGPYAGHHSLDSYGHAVLFCGSSGITHQLPYVKRLIQGFADGTVATRKITLIWIVRDSEHLEWVRPYMDEILRMKRRKEILTIKLYITRPKNPKEVNSPSDKVQMYPGRPAIQSLMKAEVAEQVGAMCVTVCGPGSLADTVRGAVRDVQEEGTVDFIEESFTW